MSKINIRPATVSDAGAMDALNRKTLPENYDLLEWVVVLRSNPDQSFIAISDGKCIGYCLNLVHKASLDCQNSQALSGVIASLAVDEHYRGQGVGEKLLRKSIEAMIARKACCITLMVRVDNSTAQKLYHKLGFKISKQIENYYKIDHTKNDAYKNQHDDYTKRENTSNQDGYQMILVIS